MSFVRKLFAVLGLLLVVGVAATLWTSRSVFSGPLEEPPLALPSGDRALVFAASPTQHLLVQRIEGDVAVGVALYTDPIDAYQALGFDGLRDLASRSADVRVKFDELVVPARLADAHVAAGTNYRAHAEEVLLDGDPFLFPKLSVPTAWNSPVSMATRLDYEAELCAVLLEPFDGTGSPAFGFMLCNDFTDRWELLQYIDLDRPMGTTGFADAKGGVGRLPVGPLLVIPEDPLSFHHDVTLSLGVNGRLRQQDPAGLMVWPPGEVVARALSDCETDYQLGGGRFPWPPCGELPAGTLILTGTPRGVIFKPINVWLSTLYLKPGDEVVVTAPGLGILRNRVVAPTPD